MKILDQDDNIVEHPDLEKGRLIQESRQVTMRYEIIREEEGRYETVAEYPNGGKDVEWVVDVPEEGHWVAYDNYGKEIETDVLIPDDMPHELEVPAIDEWLRYIPYIEEELNEIAEQKARAEEAAIKKFEQEAFLDEAPNRLVQTEVSIEDLMDAIAELGVIVAGK